MNRIDKLFHDKKSGVLSVYFCAGYPKPDGTVETIKALEVNGVDMVEVGIPFSDPMADGPVIQDAATKALHGGMTLHKLMDQLRDIRRDVEMPIILMGYLNPIVQYGFENFCRDCKEIGVDGMIIPDLPYREYMSEYKDIADKYGLHVIMLITPETSAERIRMIDEHTGGFVYMVSSAAITGAQKEFDRKKQEYFERVNSMNLKNPRMIGFGISNRQTYEAAASNASGVIIGSKFVTLLTEHNGVAEAAAKALRTALTK